MDSETDLRAEHDVFTFRLRFEVCLAQLTLPIRDVVASDAAGTRAYAGHFVRDGLGRGGEERGFVRVLNVCVVNVGHRRDEGGEGPWARARLEVFL